MKEVKLANDFWIEAPEAFKIQSPYLKAKPLHPIGDNMIQCQATTDRGLVKVQILNSSSFPMSRGDDYDDMCKMDILNEPEILYNLLQRYKRNQIFTLIGPTLIIINPYQLLPRFFSQQEMLRLRSAIIEGNTIQEKPHIYLIAGQAYNSMIDQNKKQAIVISGESGAGKTQSTKYCMQLLTSLSHRQSHPIQSKILACNPILEAFGNSKTTRNDNSSRFGKYVQIYFAQDNTIAGATINNYLLQKSRVVSAALNERSYHIFYCLLAANPKMGKPKNYRYLERTKCFEASNINDQKYFQQIRNSMFSIGFTEKEVNKIWDLLFSILLLGNVEFDDTAHKNDESKPCKMINKDQMKTISKRLGIEQDKLEKILLFEKKKFLKEFTFSAYNKKKSIANVNTLSKAIYNAIFEFILFKIQKSLKPLSNQHYKSINILDIFGFENFQINSFEQFCINFTNQKLLKLYNQYVFDREMKILLEDGLGQQLHSINPPTNDHIIELISGKLSLFSIINDLTTPPQFEDKDMIHTFETKFSDNSNLKFEKIDKEKFTIVHSQCNVKYSIDGFKFKNQDKVLDDILDIVTNLFEHNSKEQVGKTLLNKFSSQINLLIDELTSSSVHFIRCIKPNQKKMPSYTEENYILSQIRYLGVFETIQIRKKTFPSRWLYSQFVQRFGDLFPNIVGNDRTKTDKIIKQLTKNTKDYLFGDQRVYMNLELQEKISKKLHQMMKKKIQSAKKIWKNYKNYRFRKEIFTKLTILAQRIKIWKKFSYQKYLQLSKIGLLQIYSYSKNKKQHQQKLKKERQNALKNQKLLKELQSKKKIEQENKERKQLEETIKVEQKKKLQEKKKKEEQMVRNKKNVKVMNTEEKNPIENMMDTTIVEQTSRVYERHTQNKEQQHEFEFNQSFLNQQSMEVVERLDLAFQGYLKVPLFNAKKAKGLERLKQILSENFQFAIDENEEDFFSPPSDDSKFKIEQTPNDLMNKILHFQSKNFYKSRLRKRTNFIGMQKDEDDILVCKAKPLNKSLTLLSTQDENDAKKIFKSLLKISEQGNLENVFKLIETMITQCQNTSQEVKNEVLLQLLKQSNNDNEHASIRIFQTMSIFLHIYTPDIDFLQASLHFFFKKLTINQYTDKQNEYVRYLFKKTIRKIQRSHTINYMPIKYQMMALMSKRKISIPVYLPVGNSAFAKVESYQTFADIKLRVMNQFGIDSERLLPVYFSFFQIINFDNQEVEESPIHQNQIVWDTVTYWEKAKDKYRENGIVPPSFFLMFKLRYAYECHIDDEESVELMYHQTYFDYFIGRIRLPPSQIGILASCIKILKFPKQKPDELKNCLPGWVSKTFRQKQMNLMRSVVKANNEKIERQKMRNNQIKFEFIKTAQKCQLCMSLGIGTQQNIKLFMKQKKIYLLEKHQIIEKIAVKSIVKFAQDDEKFIFSVRGVQQTKIIYTEHGSICCSFLSTLPDLVTRRQNSSSDQILNF